MNPNNCKTCKHFPDAYCGHDGGHCYMFDNEPNEVCYRHTGRSRDGEVLAQLLKFNRMLTDAQKDLEPEFEKVLNDHFWELLE